MAASWKGCSDLRISSRPLSALVRETEIDHSAKFVPITRTSCGALAVPFKTSIFGGTLYVPRIRSSHAFVAIGRFPLGSFVEKVTAKTREMRARS